MGAVQGAAGVRYERVKRCAVRALAAIKQLVVDIKDHLGMGVPDLVLDEWDVVSVASSMIDT